MGFMSGSMFECLSIPVLMYIKMKKISFKYFFIILLLIFWIDLTAQKLKNKPKSKPISVKLAQDSIYEKVDSAAHLITQDEYIFPTLNPGYDMCKDSFFGTFVVSFVVNIDGTVSDFSYDTSYNKFSCHLNIAREAVKSTNKQWIPAKVNGAFVRSRYSVPISFEFEDE